MKVNCINTLMLKFKTFFEATDIFGFDSKNEEPLDDPTDDKPMRQFNLEYMIDILKTKSINEYAPVSKFNNEIQWGNRYGSVKIECDTGFTFFVKKLAIDQEGNPRWITKKAFQLNRKGLGGFEEYVAQELYECVERCLHTPVESPKGDYKDLPRLVEKLTNAARQAAQNKFIFRGVKKISNNEYDIVFEIGSQGVEARDHKRIEENLTSVSYDEVAGTIKIMNYNVVSKTGSRQWRIQHPDLVLTFFPTQSPSEICECLAVHFKYY